MENKAKWIGEGDPLDRPEFGWKDKVTKIMKKVWHGTPKGYFLEIHKKNIFQAPEYTLSQTHIGHHLEKPWTRCLIFVDKQFLNRTYTTKWEFVHLAA